MSSGERKTSPPRPRSGHISLVLSPPMTRAGVVLSRFGGARVGGSSLRAELARERRQLSAQRGPAVVVLALSLASLGALVLGAALGPAVLPDHNTSPFRLLTGVPDPFCGLIHSIFAIGHLEWSAAAEYNPLGFVAVALATLLLPRTTHALAHGRPVTWPPWCLSVLIAVILASWVGRLAQSLG
jgi:uncharacterized protein DUF2752